MLPCEQVRAPGSWAWLPGGPGARELVSSPFTLDADIGCEVHFGDWQTLVATRATVWYDGAPGLSVMGLLVFLAARPWRRALSCSAAHQVPSWAFHRWGALPTAPAAHLDLLAPRGRWLSTYCLWSVGPQGQGKMGEARQQFPGAQSLGGCGGSSGHLWRQGGWRDSEPQPSGLQGGSAVGVRWVGGLVLGCRAVAEGLRENTMSWIWLQKVLLGRGAGTGLEAAVGSPGG